MLNRQTDWRCRISTVRGKYISLIWTNISKIFIKNELSSTERKKQLYKYHELSHITSALPKSVFNSQTNGLVTMMELKDQKRIYVIQGRERQFHTRTLILNCSFCNSDVTKNQQELNTNVSLSTTQTPRTHHIPVSAPWYSCPSMPLADARRQCSWLVQPSALRPPPPRSNTPPRQGNRPKLSQATYQ